ncbi:30S ribosomal protein S3ae [Methanothermobacter sp. KEPCO-1]|uniref:Small ribosomal subunit protein eS1 n=1 Tax=Methanothermobacter marburgensis (strain ATCC BAA-927 / DSM 2133 / JCM 14651 / NBRC 100331 / OCM 82 / Marburg) TaxID=79929 RepID=D9PU90_METTM|nr:MULTISPECIES: 30S ribosomal protein S3ae [Methanothermobacter]ADL57788.1 30S ribosomal protein S3Ae [Methanothermobacter marburgensis str. Marburg]MDI9614657.1 30S ribosomal protein S3ae [Methanothermobacter sp.]QEF94331.1 30S ribosomal protein S3ae [Methanothermobacter sp. KEPCO-1]WBF10001.1 30S ribosomal protein S3ae [Methanothermobacter marburgensis]
MAKARRRRVRDTWKEKKWYVIKSPKMFGENDIGTTPSRDPDFLLKRRVEATMRELTGDFSKQYVKLKFQINNVAGSEATTKFIGHQVTTDYVRSMIRRGTSRVDAPVIVETKDGYKLKVHPLAITIRRAKSSQQKYMRQSIEEHVKEIASEKTFEEFVEGIVTGKIASEIYHQAKKIYPLKRVEIIKTRVLEEPA